MFCFAADGELLPCSAKLTMDMPSCDVSYSLNEEAQARQEQAVGSCGAIPKKADHDEQPMDLGLGYFQRCPCQLDCVLRIVVSCDICSLRFCC